MDKTTLLAYQPDYYKDSNVMENVNNANAIELNLINDKLIDTTNQVFIETATFCLERWEKEFGIKVNKSSTSIERRNRIIAKLRGQGTSTVQTIKQVAKSFIDDREVDVIEHNEDYYFEIDLKSNNGFPYELNGLYDSIEEIKPAHLNVNYKLISKLQSKIYIATSNLIGEKITIYPWTPTKIESKAETYIPVNHYLQFEKITIYPKEES